MPAYYRSTIQRFWDDRDKFVIGALTSGIEKDGFAVHRVNQTRSWQTQISELKTAFNSLIIEFEAARHWGLLFEYPIPRRQKRIDVVLLARDVIICIEFKADTKVRNLQARKQVEDYALDLRDFHQASRDRKVVPIAVSTAADDIEHLLNGFYPDLVRPTLLTTPPRLAETILLSFKSETNASSKPINAAAWDKSPYRPVPTIIEAAEALYAQHNVTEIIHSHAGDQNLEATVKSILRLVRNARNKREKIACFVTGIPGAGKTLTGLNVVHNPSLRKSGVNPGVFLSGNGPLVRVIRGAIERDFKNRFKKGDAKRETGTFIQNVHTFIKEEGRKGRLSSENVIVFDEAQRAWDADQVKQKLKLGHGYEELKELSEPEMILSIMNRHDWAVVIALVGGGQEIHNGEAGLEEWGRALRYRFPRWRIAVSPQAVKGGVSVAGHRLFSDGYKKWRIHQDPSLHLNVNRRSFGAKTVTDWVEAVISGKSQEATRIAQKINGFPLGLTRSLPTARAWLHHHTRGLQRCGLVASSGGLRLRAEGLELSSGFRHDRNLYVNWFINDPTDVRSSNQLEVAASEFECQGLELDWVGLCWSGDFIFDKNSNNWSLRSFKGGGWTKVNPKLQRYLTNKYRVLLTRARRGMIIFVPEGSAVDITRPVEWFDSTAAFLRNCGLPLVESIESVH